MVDRYRCSSTSDAQERWSPQITPSPEISLLPFNTKDTPSSTCMTVIDVLVGSVKERRCENGIPVVYTQRANCSWNIVTTYALRGTLNQAILLASGGIGSRYRGPDTAPFLEPWTSRRCSGRTSSCNMTAESLAIECAAYETSRRLRKASTGTRSQAQWWLHQERHLIAAPEGHFEKWRKTVISQVDIVTGCVLQ
ncbi:hypothetical protein PC118_g7303 [Phytophthora cactorum]|uniref:Uncharacterized protein n=1 Tax=Phytophthora cactorum TaxID=29920 RepID=A0A8T1G1N3_9STRA|nr:hypothetical protein PC113_g15562 [Phytophthora cactorum]KAG2987419.1 hypothetical protein PC118_g7303 [Phytophthora cactorum]